MKPVEEKYKVDSFVNILKLLKIKGAKKQKEFNLTGVDTITTPYNKYLEKIKKLKMINL